ncbi:MAG: DUF4301 family protein [Bacteroidales bacterium]|nr:DUF4301 family protein [Bacteroidales bacterium]
MLTPADLKLVESKGISAEMIDAQLRRFETGFPYLKINSVATIGGGIKAFTPEEAKACVDAWTEFQQTGNKIEKFVPASGAASRMFKNMFAFATSGKSEPTTDFEKNYFDNISKFAFYADLNAACKKLHGKSVPEMIADGKYVDVVNAMLGADGLNYGFLPKALLKFHKAAGGNAHTPMEEHLEEGAQYAADANRVVNLHFTVSPEHKPAFEKLLSEKLPLYEQVWGVKFNVTTSEQKASTDTIAVNLDNTPYREANGELLFRPAGHGALIENLNEREAAVVFVKNIDNVVPSKLRATTTKYKRVLAGYLVQIQAKVAQMLTALEAGNCTEDELKRMLNYVESELSIHSDKASAMNADELAAYLKTKLNRPLRVCGVVKNEGEPGGGPYLAYNPDGTYSPQILEAAQIDASKPEAVALMNSGTHFNPVDLVCYLKDYKGEKFNLKNYVDPDTGLISMKSKGGVEIKALELPGLWNGSMSDWISVFAEVPIETFNPVKTVNDLLRPEHQ